MKRLLSLDVMRGLTVFVMIIVNNGAGDIHFEMLDHSAWNGLTVCDLVFPFFLFMVGVSIHLSMKKHMKMTTAQRYRKILFRTVELFAIGTLLHVWVMWLCHMTPILPNLRFWGVLERIAICYGICSVIVMNVKPQHIWKIAAALLVIYAVILYFGNGYAQDGTNIAAIVDRLYLTEPHIYHKSPIDPEGLLGTISAVAHTLIGVMVGRMITDKEKDINTRLVNLFVFATTLAIIGHLISYQFPINKRVWSPSYTLMTCAIATSVLAFLTYIIDVKGKNKWCGLFKFYGMHALLLFILSDVIEPFSGMIHAASFINDNLSLVVDPRIASVTYAILYEAVCAICAYLYVKAISLRKKEEVVEK